MTFEANYDYFDTIDLLFVAFYTLFTITIFIFVGYYS